MTSSTARRVLFLPASGSSHAMGVVALAQGFRAAGHTVLFAMQGALSVPVKAGMHVTSFPVETDLDAIFSAHRPKYAEFLDRSREGTASAAEGDILLVSVYSQIARAMYPGLLELARRWRPDLVVYTPLQPCGPLIAHAVGVPAYEQMDGFTGGSGLRDQFREALADLFALHGDHHGSVTDLDVLPERMRPGGRPGEVKMRFLAYAGGERLPAWMLLPPGAPRIVVTFGTILSHSAELTARLRRLIDMLADLDVSVLVAMGGADPGELGKLPKNTRAYQWLPLDAILPQCAGVVHHGGQATMLLAAACGLPQLLLPEDSDQFDNATALYSTGAGLTAQLDTLCQDDIITVLGDVSLRAGAVRLASEIAEMPPPSVIVTNATQALEIRRRR